MTPAETSKALALAIGYRPEHVRINAMGNCDVLTTAPVYGFGWRMFDYRRADVIWPIAERYNAFPYRLRSTGLWWATSRGYGAAGDTAAQATALAVIGGAR